MNDERTTDRARRLLVAAGADDATPPEGFEERVLAAVAALPRAARASELGRACGWLLPPALAAALLLALLASADPWPFAGSATVHGMTALLTVGGLP